MMCELQTESKRSSELSKAQFLAYRYLTDAEFFNINKSVGAEQGGGGQSYIDFPTTDITPQQWDGFFNQVSGVAISQVANGKKWTFAIHSIGFVGSHQELSIYQRRASSVSISSQKINSNSSNRVTSWLPENGFPTPNDPNNRNSVPDGLGIFLVRTDDERIWAGWFSPNNKLQLQLNGNSSSISTIESRAHDAAMIDLRNENIEVDTTTGVFSHAAGTHRAGTPASTSNVSSPTSPTYLPTNSSAQHAPRHREKTEQELADALFSEDETTDVQDSEVKQKIQKVRVRNAGVAAALKQLYNNRCQISGDRYSFFKKDGTGYSEVHHLIPLGNGGADKPVNLVVLSPMLHRMLHYADVKGLDITKIAHHADQSASLEISINGEPFVITWRADHAKLFREQA